MADVVDLLHINDITVMRTLDPEDILAEWKVTKLLARVLIDNEPLEETEACLPIIYEGAGARPVTRWELGGLRVPTDCCPFTLVITTPGSFEVIHFEIQRGLDGLSVDVNKEIIHGDFRAQVILLHSPSHFHRRYHAATAQTLITDFPVGPQDEFSPWFPEATSAAILMYIGRRYYIDFQWGGKRQHLELARTTLERALEDPNIHPGLSQVLETIVPFLYCFEQGYSSCLDVALEVLQAFPGLPDAHLDAQLLLHTVVRDIGRRFEWCDHVPRIIRLITGPLKLLLHSASGSLDPWDLLRSWVTLASSLAPNAKEVLPLVDLAVDPHSGFPPTSEYFEFLVMARAIIYFEQPVSPDRPSLDMTLGAAELVMHSLAGRENSLNLGLIPRLFVRLSITWLLELVLYRNLAESGPYKDRLLSFVMWHLSGLPLPEQVHELSIIQSRLRGNMQTASTMVKECTLRPPTLDDNDNQFIEEIFWNLGQQTSGTEIPAEYPKGAAELARNFLIDTNSGITVLMPCGIAATIARTLRLPEAFKAYELFMGHLGQDRLNALGFYVNIDALSGPSTISLVIQDAISCATETGNHALALQWSDQGSSQIWNWFFHSRLSIGQGSATDPVVARKLKIRPPWIDSWAKHKQGEPKTYYHIDGKDAYLSISGYNRLPGLEYFLRPKTPADIISLAEVLGGPVVYLNPNRYSSHALAILPGLDDVVHIPLPRLQEVIITNGLHLVSTEFTKSPQNFLQKGKFSMERKGFKVDPPWQKPTPSVTFEAIHLLGFLWIAVVKPVLDGLGIQHTQKATADMPRIWWCPLGSLIGLPIHAAGVYVDGGQVIFDYVVSSYFPSASALAYATRPECPPKKVSLLTVANPTGAGLPGTELELEKIEKHTQAATLLTQELTHGKATVEAVKKGMENTSWAHFACHGVTNPDKPWESALILANHTRLTLREISDMSLPHAEFAYLSACQTAKGVVEAPEQSAHLSTGMLACGYRSVIGTMWQISDEYAPFVADRVYAKMLEGGQPDYKRAACSLHDAVQALRKENKVGFATWLPFIHVGV